MLSTLILHYSRGVASLIQSIFRVASFCCFFVGLTSTLLQMTRARVDSIKMKLCADPIQLLITLPDGISLGGLRTTSMEDRQTEDFKVQPHIHILMILVVMFE